jgi:hypothetical protein
MNDPGLEIRHMIKENRNSACALLIAVAAVLSVFLFSMTNVASAQQQTTPDKTKLDSNILQFKSGNHIVGFTPERAYFVSTGHALSVEFIGANKVKPQSISSSENKDTKKGPAKLGRVVYKELWPGITLRYDAVQSGLAESTYTITPGADASKIRLKYNVPVTLQKNGSLKLTVKSKLGQITESAPVAWQEINGKKVPVKVTFSVKDDEIGFETGKYDKSLPLIIDPTYEWHTFYGSSSEDVANAIATDKDGNIYVTGDSYDTWESPLHAFINNTISGYNIFVLKLDRSGTYQWHTFYGPDSVANSIAVDNSGNVYVAGFSYNAWGSPLHAFTNSQIGGVPNMFVLKLDSSGTHQWHTFYGLGSEAHAIAIDNSGNVYATGSSYNTWGTPLHDFTDSLVGQDIFVLKLDSNGTYLWHTFYGSSSEDIASAVAVDNSGNVYVTGYSFNTWGSPLHAFTEYQFGGVPNVFLLKLDSSGTHQWHTFYGLGSEAKAIAIDNSGNVYMTGYSMARWTADGNVPPKHHFDSIDGYTALFVLKLNDSGQYQWHTFYGLGSEANAIAIDNSGDVYVTGYSYNTWGSPLHPYTENQTGSTTDIFVLKLFSYGGYQWHTYYGSGNDDAANGIVIDTKGAAYISGNSWSSWGSPIHPFSESTMGANDIFVLKLTPTTCPENPVMRLIFSNNEVGIGNYYSAISTAYSAVASGDVIVVQALELLDNPILSRNINIFLSGGYECNFFSNPGRTTINGSLTISGGTVTVDNLIIK